MLILLIEQCNQFRFAVCGFKAQSLVKIQKRMYKTYPNIYAKPLSTDLPDNRFISCGIKQAFYIGWIIHGHFYHPAFSIRVIIH